MGKIAEALHSGKILVSDGAWGTFLHKKGLAPGECPEAWSLDRPGDVEDIARSYIEAGADMVETNSFGASAIKLGHFGLAQRAAEINEAAARASRQAAAERFVLGSVGPAGVLLLLGDVSGDELYEAFREQAQALERGGADAVCVETMSDAEEACIAIRAAKEHTGLEVIATFTFDRTKQGTYRTMMGLSPGDAAGRALEAGADIVGTNCGNGMEHMAEIVREMRAACPHSLIMAQANAGLPQTVDGKDVFPDSPRRMGELTEQLLAAGANIVGGCCGTTPEHIAAIRAAVDRYQGR